MSGFQSTERIERPIEEVWAGLTDWEQAPAWMNGIEQMHGPDPTTAAEGAMIVFRARGAERESIIAVWSPPRRLVLRSKQGGVTATYEYTCEPEQHATRLTLRAQCQTEGLVWNLVGPLIRWLMKRSDGGQAAALKRVLESHAQRR